MMILNSLSLSLSLFYAPHTKEKKRKEVSLSFSLSPLARAPTRREVKRMRSRFFLVSENNKQVDSDFRVFVCSARF